MAGNLDKMLEIFNESTKVEVKKVVKVGSDETELKESVESDIEQARQDSIDKGLLTENNESDYMLLDRLKSDCDYYLGYGNRSDKNLWAGNVEGQISKMRELYNKLPEKPEWLSAEDIDNYEKMMKEDSFDKDYVGTVKDNNGTFFSIYKKDGKYVDANNVEVEEDKVKRLFESVDWTKKAEEFKPGDLVDIESGYGDKWIESSDRIKYTIVRPAKLEEIEGLFNTDIPCFIVQCTAVNDEDSWLNNTYKVSVVRLRHSSLKESFSNEEKADRTVKIKARFNELIADGKSDEEAAKQVASEFIVHKGMEKMVDIPMLIKTLKEETQWVIWDSGVDQYLVDEEKKELSKDLSKAKRFNSHKEAEDLRTKLDADYGDTAVVKLIKKDNEWILDESVSCIDKNKTAKDRFTAMKEDASIEDFDKRIRNAKTKEEIDDLVDEANKRFPSEHPLYTKNTNGNEYSIYSYNKDIGDRLVNKITLTEAKVTDYISEDELAEIIKNNPVLNVATSLRVLDDMILEVTTGVGKSYYKFLKNADGELEAYWIDKDGNKLGDSFLLKEDVDEEIPEDISEDEVVEQEVEQEENPVNEEDVVTKQLDELREILPDLDLSLYQIIDKNNENAVIYIIGKLEPETDEILMLSQLNTENDDQEPHFDFIKLPQKYDQITAYAPIYGDELTPNHEAVLDYLMQQLIEVNPDKAEELNQEDVPVPEELTGTEAEDIIDVESEVEEA